MKDFWIPFNAECRSRIGWPAALKVSKDLEGAKIDDPERLCPAPVGAGFNGILGGGVGEELAFLGVLKSTGCVDILASKVLTWDYCVLRWKPPLLPLLPVPAGERLASGRSEENLTLDAGSSACATAWGEKKLLPWLCRCSYLERKPWKHHKRSKNSYSFWEMEREESRACSKSLVPDSMNRDRKVIGDVVATKATKGFFCIRIERKLVTNVLIDYRTKSSDFTYVVYYNSGFKKLCSNLKCGKTMFCASFVDNGYAMLAKAETFILINANCLEPLDRGILTISNLLRLIKWKSSCGLEAFSPSLM